MHLPFHLRKKLTSSDLKRKPSLYQRPRKKQTSTFKLLPPIITCVEDSSDNEEQEMAPKTSLSLRELMKGRNKAPSPQEASKSKPPVNPSPPPPQLPVDLGLKPNPAEEEETPRGS